MDQQVFGMFLAAAILAARACPAGSDVAVARKLFLTSLTCGTTALLIRDEPPKSALLAFVFGLSYTGQILTFIFGCIQYSGSEE